MTSEAASEMDGDLRTYWVTVGIYMPHKMKVYDFAPGYDPYRHAYVYRVEARTEQEARGLAYRSMKREEEMVERAR